MSEEGKSQNIKTSPPTSLASTIEDVIFLEKTPPNSLGTVPPLASLEFRWTREDGTKGVLLWDPERGKRIHMRETKLKTTNYKGRKYKGKTKEVFWETAGNLAETAGKAAGAAAATYEKTKRS